MTDSNFKADRYVPPRRPTPSSTLPGWLRVIVRIVLTLNGALVLLLGILPGGLMTLCAQAIIKTLAT